MGAARLAQKTVLLTFAESPVRIVFKAKKFCRSRIKSFELPEMQHLIKSIHLNSVVNFGTQEMIVPARRSVIAVTAAIDQNIVAAPANVHMQHIHLGKTIEDR